MKQEDFLEVSKTLKEGFTWMKYFTKANIPYSQLEQVSDYDLSKILYEAEIRNQCAEREYNIIQIRLLYQMYKVMKKFFKRDGVELMPFYGLITSFEEFGGFVEDMIECSIPNFIEGLDVDSNNPKDWVDFICKDDFKLHDLVGGKIKFVKRENED